MYYPGLQAYLVSYLAEGLFVRESNRKFEVSFFDYYRNPPPGRSTEIYMSTGPHNLHRFQVICTLFFAAKGHTRVSGRG
jgi:hypothetical protein